MTHLQRWMWGGDRADVIGHLAECEAAVAQAARRVPSSRGSASRVPARARRIPRRTAPLAPISENTPPPIAQRLSRARLSMWAHFWADGKRNLAQIARVDFEFGDPDEEENVAFEEVAEYVRVGVLLVYEELQPSNTPPTLQ